MNIRSLRRAALAVGCGCGALGVGLALSQGGVNAATPQQPSDAYAVFSRGEEARTAPADLPLAPDASIRAITARPGFAQWVAADDEQICITGYGPGTRVRGQVTPPRACAPAASVEAAGGASFLTTTWSPDGKTETTTVLGLVPDGTKDVSVTLADGTEATVPVVDNAVQYEVTGPTKAPTRIEVSSETGTTSTTTLGTER
jgi:hypothetical protein